MNQLTEKQIEIMSHTLGISFKEILSRKAKTKRIFPKEFYRNRFIVTKRYRHHKQDILDSLELIECMDNHHTPFPNQICYFVTLKGINSLKEHFNKLKNE